MKKLLALMAVACFSQAAIAGDSGTAQNAVKSPATVESAVSAPVQMTDAEMDKIAAGGFTIIVNKGQGFLFLSTGGPMVIRDNPGNGADVYKNLF